MNTRPEELLQHPAVRALVDALRRIDQRECSDLQEPHARAYRACDLIASAAERLAAAVEAAHARRLLVARDTHHPRGRSVTIGYVGAHGRGLHAIRFWDLGAPVRVHRLSVDPATPVPGMWATMPGVGAPVDAPDSALREEEIGALEYQWNGSEVVLTLRGLAEFAGFPVDPESLDPLASAPPASWQVSWMLAKLLMRTMPPTGITRAP